MGLKIWINSKTSWNNGFIIISVRMYFLSCLSLNDLITDKIMFFVLIPMAQERNQIVIIPVTQPDRL